MHAVKFPWAITNSTYIAGKSVRSTCRLTFVTCAMEIDKINNVKKCLVGSQWWEFYSLCWLTKNRKLWHFTLRTHVASHQRRQITQILKNVCKIISSSLHYCRTKKKSHESLVTKENLLLLSITIKCKCYSSLGHQKKSSNFFQKQTFTNEIVRHVLCLWSALHAYLSIL